METSAVKSLIIVSEDPIRSKSGAHLRLETKLLADYRPADIDKQTLDRIDLFLKELFETNPALGKEMHFGGSDLTQTISYPFASLAQHWFRTAITMRHIIESTEPDVVFVDDYWFRHLQLVRRGLTVKVERLGLVGWKERLLRALRPSALFFWMVAGLGHKALVPIFAGKICNRRNTDDLTAKTVYLAGPPFHNKSLYGIWKKVAIRNLDSAEMLFFDIRSLTSGCFRNGSPWGFAEGIAGLDDFSRLLGKYLGIARRYRKSRIPEPLGDAQGRPRYFGLLFDRFMLLNLPRALLFASIGNKMRNNPRLRRVLLSLPNSWSSASLSDALGGADGKTVSFTHGMVLDPIACRSNTSLKITWGAFDAKLLSTYSDDARHVSLIHTPHRSTPSRADDRNILSGMTAAILPSSNVRGDSLRNFLDMTLSHLSRRRREYGISSIAIKLHPRSSIDYYKKLLRGLLDGKNIDVHISKTLSIGTLLSKCKIAFCTPSSIMLELLQHKVPFSVYTAGAMQDASFTSAFPEWMRFRSKQDLEMIGKENLETFSDVADRLCRLFWHSEETKTYSIDRLADMLALLEANQSGRLWSCKALKENSPGSGMRSPLRAESYTA